MKTVGIIGFGNMGSCIAERISSEGFEIFVFDKDKNKTANLSDIGVAKNSLDLVKKVETVILAVKPQDFSKVLEEIREDIKDKLIISIAAGISTAYIEKYLGKVRVIRTMPNMLALIGKGITFLYKNKYAKNEDLDFAKGLFDNVGLTFDLSNEDMMNTVTAVSGSGPGFVCDRLQAENIDINNKDKVKEFSKDFISTFAAAAKNSGVDYNQAITLAKEITSGTIELLQVKGMSPDQLEKQIASKGGTTQAGLEVLQHDGTLEQAIEAAKKRAEELSNNK